MKYYFLISFIFTTAVSPVNPQSRTISDPGLKSIVALWQTGETDSLKKALPLYQKKYSRAPEIMFLTALFNPDAGEAVAIYEIITQRHPDNMFADQSLFKLIQYYTALGSYQTAESYLTLLKTKYPQSEIIASAVLLFQDSTVAETIQSDSLAGKSAITVFTLQVGAFSAKNNAGHFAESLKTMGLSDIAISEKIVNDKKLYTVLIGSYGNKEQAAAAGQRLKKDHKIDYSVVVK